MTTLEVNEARVAGSDTREAAATTTVRRAATGASLLCAPGWLAAFAAPQGWRDELRFPDVFVPWIVIALIFAAGAVAVSAFRMELPAGLLAPERDPRDESLRVPPGVGSAAVVVLGAFVVAVRNDKELALILLGAGPFIGGWVVGRAARLAVSAVAPRVVPAASGIVLTGALLGLLGAVHLGGIASGSGFDDAARWTIAYALGGAALFVSARLALHADRTRVRARAQATAARVELRVVDQHGDGIVPAFIVEGLTVGFGSSVILRDAGVHASSGEVVALVGANGAGKSTLLRTAAGFITPREGRVLVRGEDVSMLHAEERADAGLAFVSGARPIFPDLTVLENLRVAAFRSHLTRHSFNAATDAVLDLVPALANRRHDKAGVLSGGEQRILAVAQALYRRPAVLLADELSLGLDLNARIAVLDLVRMLADDGVAIMVVDHDLPSLLPRADRAVLLVGGKGESYPDPVKLLDRRSDLLPATFLAEAAG